MWELSCHSWQLHWCNYYYYGLVHSIKGQNIRFVQWFTPLTFPLKRCMLCSVVKKWICLTLTAHCAQRLHQCASSKSAEHVYVTVSSSCNNRSRDSCLFANDFSLSWQGVPCFFIFFGAHHCQEDLQMILYVGGQLQRWKIIIHRNVGRGSLEFFLSLHNTTRSNQEILHDALQKNVTAAQQMIRGTYFLECAIFYGKKH